MSQEPMSPEITSDDKLWAMLGYLPIIWPIPAIIIFVMDDKKTAPTLSLTLCKRL